MRKCYTRRVTTISRTFCRMTTGSKLDGQVTFKVLQSLGLFNIEICPMVGVERHTAGAVSYPYGGAAERCDRGVNALMNYRRDWDDVGKAWRGKPKHDWSSHGADAMRYLAVGYRPVSSSWGEPIRRNIRGLA